VTRSESNGTRNGKRRDQLFRLFLSYGLVFPQCASWAFGDLSGAGLKCRAAPGGLGINSLTFGTKRDGDPPEAKK
jgi:hypothetical protein